MSDHPLTRYTITSEGASLGYFRLVEDPRGVWCQVAEVEPLLRALTRERDEAVDALRQITLRVEQTAFRRIQDRAQQAEDFR